MQVIWARLRTRHGAGLQPPGRTVFAGQGTRAVLDASALVHATVKPVDPAAEAWLQAVHHGHVVAWVPELAYAETAHTMSRYVGAGAFTTSASRQMLDYVLDLPLRVESLRALATQAFALAVTRGMSVYDAYYLALAIGHDAVLVTADRRLAEQAERSALLPEEGPPRG